MSGTLRVVVGGQYGSEGKGAVAHWLAQRFQTVNCRVGGPNAGHTAWDANREWKLQQVPVGAVANTRPLYIGAGSEVDCDLLASEVEALDEAGYHVSDRLAVDRMATILTPSHGFVEREGRPHGEGGLTASIGSTGKGVGAARADRIMRRANVLRMKAPGGGTASMGPRQTPVRVVDTVDAMSWNLAQGYSLLIEGTQGYGLGLHTRNYPYVTSGDCTAVDVLAQAGLVPWIVPADHLEVWVVFRAHPIRVAGNSGPLARETTWEKLGVPAEMTTVTKKVRRVGEWDPDLAWEALGRNGAYFGAAPSPVRIALMFLDYVFPDLHGCENWEMIDRMAGTWLREKEKDMSHPIHAVGTGPRTIAYRGDA